MGSRVILMEWGVSPLSGDDVDIKTSSSFQGLRVKFDGTVQKWVRVGKFRGWTLRDKLMANFR